MADEGTEIVATNPAGVRVELGRYLAHYRRGTLTALAPLAAAGGWAAWILSRGKTPIGPGRLAAAVRALPAPIAPGLYPARP